MAQDSDEDEIWNYKIKVKATSSYKARDLKTETKKNKVNDSVHQHSTKKDTIVIDSDDDDDFSGKYASHQQQTEQWKFFLDKQSEDDSYDGQKMKAKKGKKHSLSGTIGKQREKLSKKLSVTKRKTQVRNSLNKCDEPTDDILSSANSLKMQFSLNKQRNFKRKTPEPDIFTIDDDGLIGKHDSQEKKRTLMDGACDEVLLVESEENVKDKSLSSDLSLSFKENIGIEEDINKEMKDGVGCPKVVNVVVLEEHSCHSDGLGDDLVDEDKREQASGGFLLDDKAEIFEEPFGDDDVSICADEVVEETSLKSNYFQTSSVSQLESGVGGGGFLLPSTEDAQDDVSESIKYAQSLSPSKPQKQTSLYSFFKARPAPSVEKVNSLTLNSSDTDPTNSVFGNISSRPSLWSNLSTSTTSLKVNGNSNYSIKSASDVSQMQPQAEGSGRMKNKKQCPFYKKIPGTSITVDAFRYGVIPGCQAYFLTHFHYDHYGGLTKKFAQPIYCSQVTGNLVESRLGVNTKWINRLPMWKPCQVADVTLTLMEANHCPGAVIVLFETKDGRKILHTGDFRACSEMEDYVLLKGAAIDELYLDTTYCNPSYAFPSQREVMDFVVSLVKKHLASYPKTLVICGAYTIGKEKIFTAIARALNSKICVMGDKKKVLDCLEDKELKSLTTLNWSEGRVHVLPMARLNKQGLFDHHARHAQFTSILAFEPTGWTHSAKSVGLDSLRPKWSSGCVTLYGVPYSEHSSFLELKQFVQFLQPKRILPTVNNGNPATRKKMEDIFKKWENEKRVHASTSTSTSNHQSKMDLWMA